MGPGSQVFCRAAMGIDVGMLTRKMLQARNMFQQNKVGACSPVANVFVLQQNTPGERRSAFSEEEDKRMRVPAEELNLNVVRSKGSFFGWAMGIDFGCSSMAQLGACSPCVPWFCFQSLSIARATCLST